MVGVIYMFNIKFIEAGEEYIDSFIIAFKEITGKEEGLEKLNDLVSRNTREFVIDAIESGIPFIFAIDEEKGRVIGAVAIQLKSMEVGYLSIAILKEYRGFGIGKDMISVAFKRARKFGFRTIELEVYKQNKAAINLYKSIGFESFSKGKGIEEVKYMKMSI